MSKFAASSPRLRNLPVRAKATISVWGTEGRNAVYHVPPSHGRCHPLDRCVAWLQTGRSYVGRCAGCRVTGQEAAQATVTAGDVVRRAVRLLPADDVIS